MALGNNASAPVSSCEWLDGVPDPRIRAVVQRPGDVRSRRGRSGDGSRRRRGYDVDIPWRRRERGRRPAYASGTLLRPGRPARDVRARGVVGSRMPRGYSAETSRGDAAGCRADIPRRQVAATLRLRAGESQGRSRRRRGARTGDSEGMSQALGHSSATTRRRSRTSRETRRSSSTGGPRTVGGWHTRGRGGASALLGLRVG